MNTPKKAALVSLAISCCTFACTTDQGGKEYAIPNPLCGTQLDTALYEPLYPSGGEVEVFDYFEEEQDDSLDPNGECIVEVDGEQAILIDMEPSNPEWSGSTDLSTFLSDNAGVFGAYSLEDAEEVTESPRETWVWSDLVATSVACENSDIGYESIHTAIKLDWAGDTDRSEALAAVIDPYMDEQLTRIGDRVCTPAT